MGKKVTDVVVGYRLRNPVRHRGVASTSDPKSRYLGLDQPQRARDLLNLKIEHGTISKNENRQKMKKAEVAPLSSL